YFAKKKKGEGDDAAPSKKPTKAKAAPKAGDDSDEEPPAPPKKKTKAAPKASDDSDEEPPAPSKKKAKPEDTDAAAKKKKKTKAAPKASDDSDEEPPAPPKKPTKAASDDGDSASLSASEEAVDAFAGIVAAAIPDVAQFELENEDTDLKVEFTHDGDKWTVAKKAGKPSLKGATLKEAAATLLENALVSISYEDMNVLAVRALALSVGRSLKVGQVDDERTLYVVGPTADLSDLDDDDAVVIRPLKGLSVLIADSTETNGWKMVKLSGIDGDTTVQAILDNKGVKKALK
ncbi:MAG: hypothetical protein LBR78_01240, partial [Holosporales bacterium]|nr:hypothetical protein [Holosporales bacterium]